LWVMHSHPECSMELEERNRMYRCAQHGRDLPVKVWNDEDNEVISQEQGCPLRSGI
jgi:hypothetical protein